MGCKGGVSKRVYCLNMFKVNYEVPQLSFFKTLVVFAWKNKMRYQKLARKQQVDTLHLKLDESRFSMQNRDDEPCAVHLDGMIASDSNN